MSRSAIKNRSESDLTKGVSTSISGPHRPGETERALGGAGNSSTLAVINNEGDAVRTIARSRSNPNQKTQDGLFGGANPMSPELTPEHAPPHPNIIVCGKTGAGKSSLINMIAGKDVAPTSSDLLRCTLVIKSYDVKLDDSLTVTLWDTAGLDQVENDDSGDIIRRAVCELILRLDKGVMLLIFCLRGKIQAETVENYKTFRNICHPTIPMAVVVSGLEKELDKVAWWSRNEVNFTSAGLRFDHHTCITGIKENSVYGEAYNASAKEVKAMINRAYRTSSANPISAPHNVTPHPNIIVFGPTGSGKSSLINMIAGKDVVETSSDLPRCTFDSKPYPAKLDESLTVTLWDTEGLDEGSRYDNDTIRRVCELILRLEKGVILLIFCLRDKIQAGTVENYEMLRNICHPTVPMVVVVAGLEREPNKVEWWSRNEPTFTGAGMKFDNHACIVGTRGNRIANSDSFAYSEAYDASATEVKAIIKRTYLAYLREPKNDERHEWFSRILGIIRVLFPGSNSETVEVTRLNQKLRKLGLAQKDREDIVKAYIKQADPGST
ncbi:P-loop containing nucleoside triphosphate hydrolase protein [Athelia psychrophila]|uniref:P-loop containing nucleoside triphosphate hydrolase protein n=1 Tax=Athelia psychrophila TaxID=1759441 RepID=A0A166UUN9_9AGAM|nr:P-loop containing nucleoside triphosphate hydrolase protein [Fibularhizoctonia sp. CBS 109695]